MAAAVSLAAMVTSVRRRTNLERNFNFVPDVEIVEYINEACQDLYDLLSDLGGQEWFRKTWPIVTRTASGDDPGDTYPLPPDFYKLTSAEIVYSGGVTRPIAPYMEKERATYTLLTGWSIGALAWYRMLGANQIRFIPAPAAQYTVNLNGYPTFTKLTVAAYRDSTERQILQAPASFDGINGWEQYVIWKTVARVQAKQKVDPSAALQFAAEKEQAIQAAAQNRDMQHAERVQDVVGFPDDWYC